MSDTMQFLEYKLVPFTFEYIKRIQQEWHQTQIKEK
jgi:hypothetical protein